MRLGGRLAAAIDVLEDIERRHRPAADALKDWGLSHRFAGSGDRAAVGNIVYDALRRKRSAGWLLDAETPRALGFGALFPKFDTENPAEIPTSFGGMLFMMTATAYLVVVIMLEAWPVYAMLNASREGVAGTAQLVRVGTGLGAALVVSLVAIFLPLRLAVRRIEALDP